LGTVEELTNRLRVRMRRKAPLLWIRARTRARSVWTATVQAAPLFTAFATIALGGVTFYLVTVTRAVANQTRAAALDAVRPELADVPAGAAPTKIRYDHIDFPKTFRLSNGAAVHVAAWTGSYSYDGTFSIGRSIAVRNIGNGPARIGTIRLNGHRASRRLLIWCTSSLIPPGETARLMSIELTGRYSLPPPPLDVETTPFTMTVEYSDLAGKQRQIATARAEGNYYKRGGVHLASFDVKDE
jgi:hypothetical protein